MAPALRGGAPSIRRRTWMLHSLMLLLDDLRPRRRRQSVAAVERETARGSGSGLAAIVRTNCTHAGIEDVALPADVVVSSHACGQLTDLVLERAAAARARVAVLPCCHDLAACDPGALSGWVDGPIAVDILRAMRLERQGYRIWTQAIPASITPKNRLLLGAPETGWSASNNVQRRDRRGG